MTIQTSKGKTFLAEWFGGTLDHRFVTGEIFAPLDVKLLSDIVLDFEGLDYIERYDDNEGDKRFLIEPRLRAIYWTDLGTIRLEFWGKQE